MFMFKVFSHKFKNNKYSKRISIYYKIILLKYFFLNFNKYFIQSFKITLFIKRQIKLKLLFE